MTSVGDPFIEGLAAHIKGISREACPHDDEPERIEWLAGWDLEIDKPTNIVEAFARSRPVFFR